MTRSLRITQLVLLAVLLALFITGLCFFIPSGFMSSIGVAFMLGCVVVGCSGALFIGRRVRQNRLDNR